MTGINRWSLMIYRSLQVKFEGTKPNGRIQRYGASIFGDISHVSVLLTSGELHQFHEVNGTHILHVIIFSCVCNLEKVYKGEPTTVYAWTSASKRGPQNVVDSVRHLTHRHNGWIWPVKPATMMTQEVMTQEVKLSNVYKQSCQNTWMLLLCILAICGVLVALFPWTVNQRSATCHLIHC